MDQAGTVVPMDGAIVKSIPAQRYQWHVMLPSKVTAPASLRIREAPRHAALVRVTHWITVIAFLALLITGVELVISHPRFYWGETGNSLTTPLFKIPIPASRATVPTGYG